MVRAFRVEDEGKQVVTSDGDVVGAVVRVREGNADVRPKPGLLQGCGSWITGPWDETDLFRLDGRTVERITDEQVVLDSTERDPSVPVSVSGKGNR